MLERFLSLWQVKQSAEGVAVINLTCVASLLTRTSWQLKQPIFMAECTALPFVLSSWHSRHLAASVFGASWTGCLAASIGRVTARVSSARQPSIFAI